MKGSSKEKDGTERVLRSNEPNWLLKSGTDVLRLYHIISTVLFTVDVVILLPIQKRWLPYFIPRILTRVKFKTITSPLYILSSEPYSTLLCPRINIQHSSSIDNVRIGTFFSSCLVSWLMGLFCLYMSLDTVTRSELILTIFLTILWVGDIVLINITNTNSWVIFLQTSNRLSVWEEVNFRPLFLLCLIYYFWFSGPIKKLFQNKIPFFCIFFYNNIQTLIISVCLLFFICLFSFFVNLLFSVSKKNT